MSEVILLVSLGLLTFVAIVIVLLDSFAERVLAPDSEYGNWPSKHEGLTMSDENQVVQFQGRNDLHRMFAPGVIEGGKEPMTRVEKAAVALIYITSVSIVCALLWIGIGWLGGIDLQAVSELLGVKQ